MSAMEPLRLFAEFAGRKEERHLSAARKLKNDPAFLCIKALTVDMFWCTVLVAPTFLPVFGGLGRMGDVP